MRRPPVLSTHLWLGLASFIAVFPIIWVLSTSLKKKEDVYQTVRIELLPAQQRIEEEWYKGTADAVFQNLDILRMMNPEYVLILAGDHIYKMNYRAMIDFHRRVDAELTIGALDVPTAAASQSGQNGSSALPISAPRAKKTKSVS